VGFFRRRKERPEPPKVTWERVAFARHEPEADLIAMHLKELEIPALVRRTTMDVPEMLAGGPREVLVPSDRALEARALLDPHPDEGGSASDDSDDWWDEDPFDDDRFEAER
jgi:hypothetical protein